LDCCSHIKGLFSSLVIAVRVGAGVVIMKSAGTSTEYIR